MILRRSVVYCANNSADNAMDTGFFPEPNYVLAATGGLGFAFVSYWLHLLEAWYVTIMVFSVLSLTSVWFHIWRTEIAYRVDNSAALCTVALCLYEAYRRGPIALGIGLVSALYGALVFYIGFLQTSYAFHPNRTIATFFHGSMHITLVVAFLSISVFFPAAKTNEEVSAVFFHTESGGPGTNSVLSCGV
jgi:hypothetical protein